MILLKKSDINEKGILPKIANSMEYKRITDVSNQKYVDAGNI